MTPPLRFWILVQMIPTYLSLIKIPLSFRIKNTTHYHPDFIYRVIIEICQKLCAYNLGYNPGHVSFCPLDWDISISSLNHHSVTIHPPLKKSPEIFSDDFSPQLMSNRK